MGGDNWRANDNWGVMDPCWDGWYGIECNADGYVITIALNDNNLRGSSGLRMRCIRNSFSHKMLATFWANFLIKHVKSSKLMRIVELVNLTKFVKLCKSFGDNSADQIWKFLVNNMSCRLSNLNEHFEFGAVQKCVNRLNLEKCCYVNTFLQN